MSAILYSSHKLHFLSGGHREIWLWFGVVTEQVNSTKSHTPYCPWWHRRMHRRCLPVVKCASRSTAAACRNYSRRPPSSARSTANVFPRTNKYEWHPITHSDSHLRSPMPRITDFGSLANASASLFRHLSNCMGITREPRRQENIFTNSLWLFMCPVPTRRC